MADQHGRAPELFDDLGHVGDIVGAALPAQLARVRTLAVVAEAEGVGREAVLGKIAEKMLVPAPGAVPGAMHAEDRGGAAFACGFAGDKLEVHRCAVPPRECYAGLDVRYCNWVRMADQGGPRWGRTSVEEWQRAAFTLPWPAA